LVLLDTPYTRREVLQVTQDTLGFTGYLVPLELLESIRVETENKSLSEKPVG
jgi:hypothetical protein